MIPEPRVKAGLWVQMALRMGDIECRPGVVLRRGDADAGGILVLLRNSNGICVLSQLRIANAEPAWLRATGPTPVSQDRADAYVTRQIKFDPDLWVIEFEAPDLQPPFSGRIID